jgi:hypothetical protein
VPTENSNPVPARIGNQRGLTVTLPAHDGMPGAGPGRRHSPPVAGTPRPGHAQRGIQGDESAILGTQKPCVTELAFNVVSGDRALRVDAVRLGKDRARGIEGADSAVAGPQESVAFCTAGWPGLHRGDARGFTYPTTVAPAQHRQNRWPQLSASSRYLFRGQIPRRCDRHESAGSHPAAPRGQTTFYVFRTPRSRLNHRLKGNPRSGRSERITGGEVGHIFDNYCG